MTDTSCPTLGGLSHFGQNVPQCPTLEGEMSHQVPLKKILLARFINIKKTIILAGFVHNLFLKMFRML